MSTHTMLRALLLAGATMIATPAMAQQASQAEVDALRAELAALRAEVAAMKSQPAPAPAAAAPAPAKTETAKPAPAPSWKGAPAFADEKTGASFKMRGRIQWDAAIAGEPDNYIANRNLGFNTRARRLRLGAEGSVGGGFGYKAEMDFAAGSVGFGDVIATYAPDGGAIALALGNQEPLNGMEQQTSTRWSSFMERAQVNDAFGNTRRIGLTVGTKTKDGVLRGDVGLFTAHSLDASFDNDGWIGAARVVAAPKLGNAQLHLGANYQHRVYQSNDNGVASVSNGAPSTNQFARLRARPFLQTTDVRFVDTGNFAASGDDIFGVESYAIMGPLHVGGEAQWMRVKTYRPGVTATGLDAFAGNSAVTPATNPGFFGGHVELGYFLTGETRGYKNGLWDRTKVANPLTKGGMGAWQIIGRYDHLDLDDAALKSAVTTNTLTGTTSLSSSALGRGGTQTGYLIGLTWIPMDYVRIMANYIHTRVEGGPLQATVNPTATAPVDARRFSTDSFGIRTQIDF